MGADGTCFFFITTVYSFPLGAPKNFTLPTFLQIDLAPACMKAAFASWASKKLHCTNNYSRGEQPWQQPPKYWSNASSQRARLWRALPQTIWQSVLERHSANVTETSDSLPAVRFGITAIAISHDYFPMLLSTVQRSPLVAFSFCGI